jgi:CheY-like chemotaxis protein
MTERRVLVVEDEESIRLLMRRLLLQQGFTVETATDGQEGIDRLSDSSYDVMVLDLMMPRVSGLGVLQYLDTADPDMIRRTVVATAYPGALAADELKRVCRVIRKPFELTTLLDAVEACRVA